MAVEWVSFQTRVVLRLLSMEFLTLELTTKPTFPEPITHCHTHLQSLSLYTHRKYAKTHTYHKKYFAILNHLWKMVCSMECHLPEQRTQPMISSGVLATSEAMYIVLRHSLSCTYSRTLGKYLDAFCPFCCNLYLVRTDPILMCKYMCG